MKQGSLVSLLILLCLLSGCSGFKKALNASFSGDRQRAEAQAREDSQQANCNGIEITNVERTSGARTGHSVFTAIVRNNTSQAKFVRLRYELISEIGVSYTESRKIEANNVERIVLFSGIVKENFNPFRRKVIFGGCQ